MNILKIDEIAAGSQFYYNNDLCIRLNSDNTECCSYLNLSQPTSISYMLKGTELLNEEAR